MLKFADVADEPKDKSFFERIVTGSPDSLDRYWREMSYGRINLDGSKAFGWLTLPKPRAYYFYDKNGDGVPELDTRRISQDGTETALAAGVPVRDFYGVNFALNTVIPGIAGFGGGGYAIIGGQYIIFSATYLPIPGYINEDVFAHEMGHGYDFPHSLPLYGSAWDVMSATSGLGTFSTEFSEAPVGTIAKNRADAGWLAPGREQTTGKAGEFTFELAPLSREGGTAYIKVPIRGVPWGVYFSPHFNSGSQFGGDYYTVEAREQTGFDRNIPANAVVIHKVTGNSYPPASVVTASADGNPNDAGGQWTEGESFEDQSAGISIRINKRTAAGTYQITVISKPRDNFSFDPGGRAYLSVFRPENNTLYRLSPSGEFSYESFGIGEDRFAVGDYDGNGTSDAAVFRPSSATWYIQRPDKSLRVESFGATGDAPAAADYDGDGKTDIAVFRPQTGVWYIKLSSGIYGGSVQFPLYRDFYIQQFGKAGDVPAPADYDGDGKADLAVYRPETGVWYVKPTNTRVLFFDGDIYAVKFGQTGDIPVSADYDGDRITDFAVYRPETGVWYVLGSKTGFYAAQFGIKTDIPVAADYDGDGKTDLAVFRPETGVWYYLRSSTGGFNAVKFGQNGDRPLNRREK